MKRRTLLAVTGAATLPTIAGCIDDEEPVNEGPGDDGTSPPETERSGTDNENGVDDDGNDMDRQPLFADSFSATSQGGFLTIGENVERTSQARDAGYTLPDGKNGLTLEAEVADDGRWRSTQATFPSIQANLGIEVSIELPNGLHGIIFQNRMTAIGTLRVVVERLDGDSFNFEIEATSEESGTLEGETDFEGQPLTVTLVDNEFTIDEKADSSLINSQLGLPSAQAGTNWFEIELKLTGA